MPPSRKQTQVPRIEGVQELRDWQLPPLRVRRFVLNEHQPDAISILQHLDFFKRQYARSPFVREATVRLLHGLWNNDQEGQLHRIVRYVKKHLIYVRDPSATEYVQSPVRLLKRILSQGRAHGDCDDHALLLNAMLESVGIKTRFLGVKLQAPGAPDRYNHVISSAHVGGQWRDIDACAKDSPQRVYPERLAVGSEDVDGTLSSCCEACRR